MAEPSAGCISVFTRQRAHTQRLVQCHAIPDVADLTRNAELHCCWQQTCHSSWNDCICYHRHAVVCCDADRERPWGGCNWHLPISAKPVAAHQTGRQRCTSSSTKQQPHEQSLQQHRQIRPSSITGRQNRGMAGIWHAIGCNQLVPANWQRVERPGHLSINQA